MTDTLTRNSSCCQEQAQQAQQMERQVQNDNRQFSPRFDIRETDDELVLYGDLPGVTPEDLDIRFENGELSIHGKVAERATNGSCLYREYGVGDYQRTFTVSESINADAISAELKNGVLVLRLPKTEAVKPRRIQVQG